MNEARWTQIIRAAYADADLCNVLATFLADNQAELKTRAVANDGRLYKIVLNRPHIAEVERVAGRKHLAVKA